MMNIHLLKKISRPVTWTIQRKLLPRSRFCSCCYYPSCNMEGLTITFHSVGLAFLCVITVEYRRFSRCCHRVDAAVANWCCCCTFLCGGLTFSFFTLSSGFVNNKSGPSSVISLQSLELPTEMVELNLALYQQWATWICPVTIYICWKRFIRSCLYLTFIQHLQMDSQHSWVKPGQGRSSIQNILIHQWGYIWSESHMNNEL